jgi:tetratricopeptide (TPR) repeat protein
MSKLEKLKDKAKTLEARDPKAAVETWLEVLKSQDEESDPTPDLAIYNRVGDLYLKLKDPAQAADWYDQAVDKYAELGFHNNAIAMCNKVLRNAPARQQTYLKLAKLYASKGFLAEAQQHFVEYAERMQKSGRIQQAFAALKEFTDLSPESERLRVMLEEHLKMYGEDLQRRSSTRVSMPPPSASPATSEGKGKRKTSSLVFLDVDAPARPAGKVAAPPKAAPPSPPPPKTPATPPADDLQIESSALHDPSETMPTSGGLLDGFETTSAGFGGMDAPAVESIRDDEPSVEDVEPLSELEPTSEEEDLDVEEAPPPPPPKAAPTPKAPLRFQPKATPPPPAPKVKPVVPKRPSGPQPPAAAPAQPPKRKTVVEIPPLELEPDFEAATTAGGHDLDDEPLAIDEGKSHPDWVQTEDDTSVGGRRSGYMDLGLDGVVNQGGVAGSLVFDNIEESASAPGIEELEGRVADNPDDPEAHQSLGEALIEAGKRDRGIEELDLAVAGFESIENLQQAQDLLDEILRLDPNSVRHRQKQVEVAFKAGDKPRLVDAYLELADTLLRTDLGDKAMAVYQRVVEHDPKNERAKAALAMLMPVDASSEKGKLVQPKDAKMKVRDEAGAAGDFVDLGAMILDDDVHEAHRDTRMKVQDEEPTGDEEKDFQDMLARFRQGIEENIDEADFQSHYDLGVAFKEMGLLDEAIAELQKALRAPEGKLRTSEALGVCFFEKGAYAVAESILRRGLELKGARDEERLGIFYWLGRALEAQGNKAEAKELYGRVFAVNVRFMDVGDRVKALAKAR